MYLGQFFYAVYYPHPRFCRSSRMRIAGMSGGQMVIVVLSVSASYSIDLSLVRYCVRATSGK